MECLLSDRLNPSPSETVSYDSFVVTQVWFTGSSSLYVDNLAIARTPIQGKICEAPSNLKPINMLKPSSTERHIYII